MKTRRQITLPNGGTCIVRKLAQSDYLASGQMPLFLKFGKSGKLPKVEEISDEETVKMVQSMAEIAKVKLTRCCGSITTKDGRFTIVDKPLDELSDFELSIEELDQIDANAICDAVDQLSGMKKEAAQAAATFPEGSQDGGSVSSVGDQLQSPTNTTSGP